MKLTELNGNVGKYLCQTAPSVANDALYFNAFGFQAAYLLGVKRVGFVFDFADGQGFAADAVEQNHDAERTAEVGGVHDDVGCFGSNEVRFNLNLFEMSQNGLPAASVSFGELCGGLFAYGIGLPECLWIEPFAAIEVFVAALAFVLLDALMFSVLFDVF